VLDFFTCSELYILFTR